LPCDGLPRAVVLTLAPCKRAHYLAFMAPPALARVRRNKLRLLSLVLVGSAVAAMGWLMVGNRPQRVHRLIAEAAARGWLIEADSQEEGLVSSILRNARLSYPRIPGLTAEISRIEIPRWPWLRPRLTVSEIRARLHGDPAAVLSAVRMLAELGRTPRVVGQITAVYHHRALGSVELSGVAARSQGSTLLLDAERVIIGGFAWQSVTLALEPRNDMLVIAIGDSVARAPVQLSWFASSGGISRLILDIPHQAARPLAGKVGSNLGPDFDATRVAGTLSLDLPDADDEPVRGRVQIVLDRWPSSAPAAAEPLLGSTWSLLSNVVPAANGAGWDLPRVELTTLVFKLVGKGHLDLSAQPQLALDGEGERTCRQLGALMPPSEQRDRVEHYLAGPSGKALRATEAEHARLKVRWTGASGTGLLPLWDFQAGCGLDAWQTTLDTTGR
jgi:hypothetical protein